VKAATGKRSNFSGIKFRRKLFFLFNLKEFQFFLFISANLIRLDFEIPPLFPADFRTAN
jgi:hypothetical protein